MAAKKQRPVAIPVEVGQRRRDPDKRASRVVKVVYIDRGAGALEPCATIVSVDGRNPDRCPRTRIKLATIERWELVEPETKGAA